MYTLVKQPCVQPMLKESVQYSHVWAHGVGFSRLTFFIIFTSIFSTVPWSPVYLTRKKYKKWGPGDKQLSGAKPAPHCTAMHWAALYSTVLKVICIVQYSLGI